MAKSSNSNSKKKRKNRRLKRSIMGTLSAIFMISAIIVALVPVPETKAAGDPSDLIASATADPNYYIPDYQANNYPVFANADGNFRVAYGSNGGNMTGVVVYYNLNNVVSNASLQIPSQIEAFLYNKELEEYVAVDKDKQILYYTSQEAVSDTYTEEGTLETPGQNQILSPCTASTQGTWAGQQLYQVAVSGPLGPVELVSGNTISYSNDTQLVINVQYIGSTRYNVDLNLLNGGSVDGIYDTTGKGVFEGATNFYNLDVPSEILSIGNNAFKGCQLQSVKMGNGVHSIGNHAFDNCNQLSNIEFDVPSNLVEIGDYAFTGCTYLTSIKIPDTVAKLGNYCFKDCTNLSAVNVYGTNNDGNTQLTTLGNGVFYNCNTLGQLELPLRVTNINEVQYLCYNCNALTYLGLPANAGSGSTRVFKANNVTGCNSLDTVKVPANDLKLECNCAENTGSGLDDIYTGGIDIFSKENLGKNSAFESSYEVSDQFCILANSASFAHTYSQKHHLSFGYLDTGYVGWYERIEDGYAFIVNESNELVKFEKKDSTSDGKNVIIPDNIAKFHVNTISSGTFSGNTDINYLYIPASVSKIEGNAFKGCTSLRTVNFDNAKAIQEIGTDAFKTGVTAADIPTGDKGLNFIGDISSDCVPYLYAMNADNKYNAFNAPEQYITYCSNFPLNIQIKLNVVKNANTNEVDSVTPVVVAVPNENQLNGTESYSLSTYTGTSSYVKTKTEENLIVGSAYNKYLSNISNPTNPQVLTEEEQAVIDAVYHVHIPDGVVALDENLFKNNTGVQSVILDTVKEVPDHEFEGCTALNTFIMGSSGTEGGEKIGERAFQDCIALMDVTLPNSLTEMGYVPFSGCNNLTDVSFCDSDTAYCKDGIIYQKDADGNTKIIECLPTRGIKTGAAKLSTTEFANVTEIEPYAFQNCTGIREAYLDASAITIVPDYCFDGATQLYYCSLPNTAKKIGKYAFRNTALSTAYIPGSVQSIDDTAFITDDGINPPKYIQGLTIQCEEDSPAYWYCSDKDGITADTFVKTYTVTFLDWDGYELAKKTVNKGASAEPPRVSRPGYSLTGWTVDFSNVTKDITTQAVYEIDNAPTIDGYYSVTFQDFDGLYTWDTQYLKEGSYPTIPAITPTRKGYKFSYWSPSNFPTIAVTGNLIIKAYYTEDPTATEDPSGDNGNNNNNNNNNGDNGNDNKTTYTVTFVDYNGTVLDTQNVVSGSCPTATTVKPTRKGYTFTTWSPSNYATTPVTSNLTVTALYKKGDAATDTTDHSGQTSADTSKGETSGTTSNGTNNNTNGNTTTNTSGTATNTNSGATNKPNGTVSNNTTGTNTSTGTNKNNTTSGQTTVKVTKSGIPYTDLVSADVSGSNDNFVVKIEDSDTARAAIEKVLKEKYGSLDNIKYFAMDISLYDSTGTTKIADTSNLSVTVTFPIPEVMAGYAGNNKFCGVKNDSFEEITPRFVTINNNACMSVVLKHFSPYAVYVQTDNLTQGVTDATPTTGDPIHPKWFLTIGLALLSILLFLGKGSKNKVVKVV